MNSQTELKLQWLLWLLDWQAAQERAQAKVERLREK